MGGRLSRTPKNIPKTSKPVKPAKPVEFSDINPDYKPGDGFRSMGGSQAFRALNFELYVQTNPVIMAFGIVSITLVTVYFAYMNATTQNKELDQEYDKLYGAGAANYMRERKVNKWE